MTKRLSTAIAGDLCDWTGSGVKLKGNPSSNNEWIYLGDGTNTDITLQFNGPLFSGTGDGTFNHNCTWLGAARAPADFSFNSYTGAPFGSQTMGFSSITTTQVTVKTGAGLAWNARGWAK